MQVHSTPPPDQPVHATHVSETAVVPPPRIWPSLVVGFGAIPLLAVASIMIAGAAVAFAIVFGHLEDPRDAEQWLTTEFMATPGGLLIMLVPLQVLLLAVAVISASLSPTPAADRLGLVRGHHGLWMLPVFMGGMIFVMLATSILLERLFDEPSPHLAEMGRMFAEAPLGIFVILLLFVSIAPGVCEELVFRGYVQRRLMQRWSPLWAILLPTVLFGVAHLDVQHSLGAFTIGLWLALIMWRTGSVWPCIICHAANNAAAVLIARAAGGLEDPDLQPIWYLPLLIGSCIAFLISILLLVRIRRRAVE